MRLTLTIGTRSSKLALWQSNHVAGLLAAAWPGVTCELAPIVTSGDRVQDRPLPAVGGKGLFTGEIEAALRSGAIDLAVHSLKDLPVADSEGLVLGAILLRSEVRDALLTHTGQRLVDLPPGAKVGTSSVRRAAQLRRLATQLDITDIRGNVDTRVRKVQEGAYDAVVLAGAGLMRLGLDYLITEWLGLEAMLPAPGQGALAVQCRADDPRVRELLAVVHDPDTAAAVAAERLFLSALGGGCSAPIAAYAARNSGGCWSMQALVASVSGDRAVSVSGEGDDPQQLARDLAEEALARGAGGLVTAHTREHNEDSHVAKKSGSTSLVSTSDVGTLPEGSAITSGLQTESRALHGKRVVVTRSVEQGAELCALLAAAGASPVEVPVLRIAPLEDQTPLHDAIQNLANYTWVLFTSVNAVRVFFANHILSSGWPAGVHAAAVGPATAAELRDHGVEPALIPDRYEGSALAEALVGSAHSDVFPRTDAGPGLTGQRVLLPRAEIADRALSAQLAAAGAEVHDIPIYHTLPAPIETGALAELAAGCDAITFASSSAVRFFLDGIAGYPGVGERLRTAVVACIGPKTAATATELGWPEIIVADEATSAGLVNALAAHFERKAL